MSVPYDKLPQYSAGAAIDSQTRQMYPSAYREFGVQPAQAPAAPAGQGTPTGGPPKYPDAVLMTEQKKGGKLTPEELLEIRSGYRSNVVYAGNLAAGHKQFQIEGALEIFDANADAFDAKYLAEAEAAAAQAAPVDPYGNSQVGENVASFIGGAINTLGPGALSLADQAMRMSPAVGLYNMFTGGDRQGVLGRTAADLSKGVDEAVDQYRTQETELADLRTQEALAAVAKKEDATIVDWIEAATAGGRRSITRQLSGVVGGMAPGIGAVSKARATIEQLPKAMQRLTRAFALGGPQAAAGVNTWESDNLERPIEEFGAEVRQASLDQQELGIPKEEADRIAKQAATAQARPIVAIASYLANVGLAALPGMGTAERLITRSGKPGNFLGRMIGSAAEETAEESAAGAIEQFGQNAGRAATGQQVPLSQGVKGSAAQGGVMGFLVGAGGGAIPQPNAATTPQTPNPATPAPTAGVATPTPGAPTPATPAPTGPSPTLASVMVSGPGLPQAEQDTMLAGITSQVKTSLAGVTAKQAVGKLKTPEQIIEAATANASALAGTSWQGMTSVQKIEAIETVIDAYKSAKATKVNVGTQIEALRGAATAATTPATPQVTGQPLPPGVGTAPAAPVQPTTPAPRGKKPLAAPPATTPVVETAAAPAETPQTFGPLTTWGEISEGDKLTAMETIVAQHNAANPTAPISIGALMTGIQATPPAELAAATLVDIYRNAAQIAARASTPATPAAATPAKKPLAKPRKPVPAPPAKAAAAPATPAPTPAAAAPVATPAPTTPATKSNTIDSVNAIIAAAPVEVRSEIVDAVNASKKAKNNQAIDAAISKHGFKGDAAGALRALTGNKPVPPPPSKTKAKPLAKDKPKAAAKPLAKGKAKDEPKGGTPDPKPVAPAGAGAEGRSATPKTTESVGEAIGRITNNELSAPEEQELVDAVRIGREAGDPGPISAAIKQLEEDGAEFTPEQKRMLRELATPQAIRAPTVEGTVPKPEVETVALDDSPSAEEEVDQSVLELAIEITKARNASSDPNSAGAVLRAVGKSKYATKHQKWLALRIAPILDKLGTRFAFDESMTAHGKFFPAANVITLRTVRPSTIIHEALHAVTSHAMNGMLPNTDALSKKWDTMYTYLTKYIATQSDNGAKLGDVPGETPDFLERVINGLERKEELLTYALTDKNMRGLLSQIPAMDPSKSNSFWEEFKGLLVDFYTKLFKADISQRSFLDEVIEAAAETVRATEAAGAIPNKDLPERTLDDLALALEGAAALSDAANLGPSEPSAKKLPVQQTPVQRAQRLWELFANAFLGIEKSMQDVLASGGEILAAYNPYYAVRKYTSDMAEMKNIDNMEVVEPVRNWITANWRKFGSKDAEEFRKDLDKFMQSQHMLVERNPTIWAETAELSPFGEIERGVLIDRAYKGELTSAQLNSELISLASRTAKQDLDTWTNESKLAKSNASLRTTLNDLKKKGFDSNSLKEFNALVQDIRNRSKQRMIDSGVVSESDPFADRGWEWYVPLKGHISISEEAADYDIGSTRGATNAFRGTRLKVLEGRQSTAGNALTQLVEDMNNAATAAAKSEFTSKIFEYAVLNKKNKEILHAHYRKYYGTPKSGYYSLIKKVDKKTGKVTMVPGKVHKEVPVPKNAFVHHNGQEHYVVYLPADSQLLRGMVGLNRVLTPGRIEERDTVGKGIRGVGYATNIMARAYTTWSPVWQAMVGFLRDTSTLPTTVAVQVFDNPIQATRFATVYAARLAVNTAQLARLPSVIRSVAGNKAKLREYVAANPGSLFAQIVAYRDAGGSTEFAQGLNQESADDFLFGRMELTVGKGLKRGYDAWNEGTSNWAALLENVGRVSAWEALKSEGMSDQEAAAITKSALDYSQSGEWGRMINAFQAFFRVGATSLDTMRRAFTKPTGEFDMKKLVAWTPAFMGIGYIAYYMMAMMLGDDEDGLARIKKMDANTLTQRFLFPSEEEGKTNSFPIGLGIPQLFMVPGILAAAVNNGHISKAEAVEAYYQTALRSSPIQPAGWKKGSGISGFLGSWLLAAIPTPGKPFVELHTNTNAFGNVVHTAWVDSNKDKANQGMPATGTEWKEFAQFMRDKGVDMYPEDWAHLARGYGGQVASEIVRWTIDKDKREMEGVDSSAIRTSMRLGVTDEDFYYRNEARDIQDILGVSKRRLKAATDDGIRESTWLSQNPRDRRRIAEWKALDKARDKYYEEIAAIRDNKLLSAEGRRLQRRRADARLREAVNRAQRIIDATDE